MSQTNFSPWQRILTRRFSITRKIVSGYSLAVGVAVLGTSIGLILGDSVEKQAQQNLSLAHQQQYLLNNLESGTLSLRSHPQQLLSVLDDSIWFQYETEKFLNQTEQTKNVLLNLEGFIKDNHGNSLAEDVVAFREFLQSYRVTFESYAQLMQQLWAEIDHLTLDPEQTITAQQQVLLLLQAPETFKIQGNFERLLESLTRIIDVAETQQLQANADLMRADTLRFQTIVGSMILSIAIAAWFAVQTSRAIANPIKAVTQVAQRVTQEANFNLQVNVSTQDEVQSLANSLNQLIQWMGDYTRELNLTYQVLEKRTQDLSEALEDLKTTQTQLIQTEKMSSLGQMVAGVAHEINNPINFIYGNLAFAQDYARELIELLDLFQQSNAQLKPEIIDKLKEVDLDFLKSDFPQVLDSMYMGTERIYKIVCSLRNFSRLDESDIKSVDIHEGIDNTLVILNHRLKKGVKVLKDYGELPLISCYPAQLNQVFMNIITNALDAMEIESYPNKQLVIQTSKLINHTVQVVIKDNGPGIPPEIQAKIFDPFFTTKPIGKGTGLGLGICYQILAKHGGKIDVNSALGEGTAFIITLPDSNNLAIDHSLKSDIRVQEVVFNHGKNTKLSTENKTVTHDCVVK